MTETLAGEEEVLGRPGEAFRHYLRAVDVCLKRGAADAAGATDAGAVNRLTASALATARSGDERASLVQVLRHHLDRLVADSARGRGSDVPGAVTTLAGAVRQAAFVSGDLAAAEQGDGLLCTTWPDDGAFRRGALAARVDAGLFDEARRFAGAHGLQVELPAEQGATARRLDAGALPWLIADGEMDLARRVVRSAGDVSPSDADRTLPILIAGAAAVGDEEAITRWGLRWLAVAGAPLERAEVRGPNGGREAAEARRHVAAVASAVWGVLPTAGRRPFIQALLDTGREAPAAADGPAVLAIRLAAAGGINLPDRAAVADRLLRSPASADAVAAELFAWFPRADRPALLRLALERIAPAHRLAFLLAVTDRTTDRFDDETARIIADAAAAIPAGQVVSPSEWFTNAAQRRVLPALADAVLRTRGAEAAEAGTAVPCAAALAIGGDAGRADALALGAIERLWSQVAGPPTVDPPDDPTVDAVRWLRVAWGALSAQGQSAALRSATAERTDDTAWRRRCAATLLRAAGRPADALALERRTFADHPNDDGAAAALAEGLASDGRLAELVDTFGPASGRAWGGAVRRQVVAGLRALHRSAEARRFDPAEAATAAAGDGRTAVAETGRLRLERARASGEPFDGGRMGADTVAWPEAVDDLVATLRAMPVREDAPSVVAMVRSLGEAVGRRPERRGALLDALAARAAAGTFLTADGLILEELAMDPNVRLAPALVAALRQRAGATGEDGAFEALAAGAAGSPGASGLRAWVAARRRMDGSDGAGVPPDPLAEPADAGLADAMRGLIDRGLSDGVERELAALRAHGQVGRRQGALGMVWARLAAERGDLPAFGQRLAEALEGGRWRPDAAVPDVRLAMPVHGDVVAVATAAAEVIERAADGDRGRAGFTVALAGVGSWAHDRGATAAARDLLARAGRLAGERGAGPDRLAVADLADRLGDGTARDAIELDLLRERRLPSGRIVPLIIRLAGDRSRSEVGRLARDAAVYCREPGLLAWLALQRRFAVDG